MVFIANIIHLTELANYAKSALSDKRELVSLLDGYQDLKQMITVVNINTIITFSETLTWQENNQFDIDLSKKRADAVREFLYEIVFKDKEKYKIYSSGVWVNQLIYNHDKINGDRCIEIAFKYDALDMVKKNK